jgi:hypothetical protein
MVLNLVDLWWVLDSLLHPLYNLGILSGRPDLTCELRAEMFMNERNAHSAAASIFLWFVLRRLLDIQAKLHESRSHSKWAQQVAAGPPVPMGQPVAPDKKRD